MAIAKRVNKQAAPEDVHAKAVDAFINSAPDSGKSTGLTAGRRRQISHALMQHKLDALDAMSAKLGISRAALINIGIDQVLNRGVSVGGED
ncbi:hypothetical protein QNL30_02740 [Pseudomonas amygdali pv. morsprunorum]|uniref:Ribbon-helix-helix protein CopG domain-containing protein n=1 Tax=Pseudomonas amygdali pv. morsprunorum TaxID=129138 RepID=A0AB35QYV2_PSEA0|nr:hypothetical protein [Pseudomonas amygdali]MDT3239586.1 hypothetical protein [Pseudomonas amygdali pv. morsprunorum]